MNKLWKKTIAIGIFALFLTMMLVPSITADNSEREKEKEHVIIQGNLRRNDQIDRPSIETPVQFQNELNALLSDLTAQQNDLNDLQDLLNWLLNRSDFPLLSFLLSQLIRTDQLQNREIIISAGWNYNMNPLKKNQFEIIKPVTFWKYSPQLGLMNMPSSTYVISLDPVVINKLEGNQFGFMFRFRGVYGHIPQQYPNQSFTYIVGTAKGVTAFELPSIDNLFGR